MVIGMKLSLQTPFFNAHPPLSQYIIGIGIWISSHFPFWQEPVNGLTGSLRSPWSYRWLNALTGSFIPLVVAAVAYQISHRRSFALLAGLFTACDGIFLVESRYALNNIYIVIFGLLGQWFLLLALDNQKQRRCLCLILAGISFGASAGTKWKPSKDWNNVPGQKPLDEPKMDSRGLKSSSGVVISEPDGRIWLVRLQTRWCV